MGTTCLETSAKQRINVDEAFAELVRNIRRYTDESAPRPTGGTKDSAAASSGGGGHVPLKTDSHDGGCCGGCVIL
jgi:GTPase KRas protein